MAHCHFEFTVDVNVLLSVSSQSHSELLELAVCEFAPVVARELLSCVVCRFCCQ